MSDAEFWPVVGAAAGIATAVATGLSTILALWWRRLDQRAPYWVVEEGRSIWRADDGHGNREEPHAEATIANAGDGTAYQVTLVGVNCTVWLRPQRPSPTQRLRLVPAVAPGQSLGVHLWCEPTQWCDAYVLVQWQSPPMWRKRKRAAWIALESIAPRPTFVSGNWDPLTGASIDDVVDEPAPPVLSPEHAAQVTGRATTRWQRRAILRAVRRREAGRPA